MPCDNCAVYVAIRVLFSTVSFNLDPYAGGLASFLKGEGVQAFNIVRKSEIHRKDEPLARTSFTTLFAPRALMN